MHLRLAFGYKSDWSFHRFFFPPLPALLLWSLLCPRGLSWHHLLLVATWLQQKWPWWSRGAVGSSGCLTKKQSPGCPLWKPTLHSVLYNRLSGSPWESCSVLTGSPPVKWASWPCPTSQGCSEDVGVMCWESRVLLVGAVFGNDIKLICMCGLCQHKYNYFKHHHFQWLWFVL